MEKVKKHVNENPSIESCPVQHSLQFIGGKWRIGILWSLKDRCRRFGELRKDVLGISEKMLIQELRHLEQLKIVQRKDFPIVPPKVEYSLTERGKTLIPMIENVVAWGYADMAKNQTVS